jgi:hypothetical protein
MVDGSARRRGARQIESVNVMNSSERKHIAAWLVLPLLAVANGAIRDLTYGRSMSPTVAHSISVVPLIAVILMWATFIERRWPLRDGDSTARVGLTWFGLTLTFELALGAALRVPLADMLAAYDVTRGHLWPLSVLTMAFAPELARRWTLRSQGRSRVSSIRSTSAVVDARYAKSTLSNVSVGR